MLLLVGHAVDVAASSPGRTTLGNWNIVATGIVPFVIFMIAATAELNRPPFDLVEAEQELVGGFNTEYSAFGFALFFLAEFMNIDHDDAASSSRCSSVVRSRCRDRRHQPARIPRTARAAPSGSSSSCSSFLYIYVWFRATLPRLRYDQLMDLGWKVLIPISLGWFLLLAAIREFSPDGDWQDSVRGRADQPGRGRLVHRAVRRRAACQPGQP